MNSFPYQVLIVFIVILLVLSFVIYNQKQQLATLQNYTYEQFHNPINKETSNTNTTTKKYQKYFDYDPYVQSQQNNNNITTESKEINDPLNNIAPSDVDKIEYVYMPSKLWRNEMYRAPVCYQTTAQQIVHPMFSPGTPMDVVEFTGIGSILPTFQYENDQYNNESEKQSYLDMVKKSQLYSSI